MTCFPIIAQAQSRSIAELEAIIKALQAQLASLVQNQGNTSGGGTTGAGDTTCGVFTTVLRVGSAGKEVVRLQAILNKEGFAVTDEEAGRGYYGQNTADAVSRFQVKYRADILTPAGLSQGTGIVGFGTIKKLNQLYSNCSAGTTPQTSTPTVRIVASANSQSSDGAINANVGKTLTISATVKKLPETYQRAFFFSPLFDGTCTNQNNNSEWVMECVPNNTGVGTFYLEVYGNGQTYRSNTVTVTVYPSTTLPPPPTWHQCPFEGQPDSPTCVNPIVTGISSKAFYKGQEVEVTGTGFRHDSQVMVTRSGTNWFHATRLSVSPTSIKFRIDKDIEFGSWGIKVDQTKYDGRASSETILVDILDKTQLWTALSIQTNWTLPEAKAGSEYFQSITASGGDADYRWSISSGLLPDGLKVVEMACRGGVCKTPFSISGTPTKAGTYAFTVTVQSGSQTMVRMFTLTVTEDLPPRDAPAMNITGYLDSVTCDTMGGWAQDLDTPEASLGIEVWSFVGGSYWKKIHNAEANIERADVGKHAFSFFTPSALKDGKNHSVYIYAKGANSNEYTKLTGSGVALTCGNTSQGRRSSLVANSFEMIKNLFGNLLNR